MKPFSILCNETSCLRKKGTTLVCHYGFPFKLHEPYSMFSDDAGEKTYILTRNDEILNIHNSFMLLEWRANVDYHHVLSHHVVLTYIWKYASKSKKKSKIYIDILSCIAHVIPAEEAILFPFWKLLSEVVTDRDIGVQETCHMLQKIPLKLSRHSFVSLNVS